MAEFKLPGTLEEAQEQDTLAQGAAADAITARNEAIDDFDSAESALNEAIDGAQGIVDGLKDELADAKTDLETAEGNVEAAKGNVKTAEDDAREAQGLLNDEIDRANELIDAANIASAALITAVESHNGLLLARNAAVNAANDAINNGDSAASIDSLRRDALEAIAAFEDFDVGTLDHLEEVRDLTEAAALAAKKDVFDAQDAFDTAMGKVEVAIAHLNAMEIELVDAQRDVFNATNAVNKAIADLNEALEELHNAEQVRDEAIEYAQHWENIAAITAANVTAWQDHINEMEQYELDMIAHNAAHEAWKNNPNHGSFFEDEYEKWEALMERYNLNKNEFPALQEAYEKALAEYNTAKAEFEARNELWNEWQELRPESGEGIVRTTRIFNGTDITGGNPTDFELVIAPGVVLTRGSGGNSSFTLTVSSEASMGTVVLGARHGGNSQITTIDIWEAGEIVDFVIHPNSNMSQFQLISYTPKEGSVFDGTAPIPPTPPVAPPQPPVHRGPEPIAPPRPDDPDLDEIDGNFVFKGTTDPTLEDFVDEAPPAGTPFVHGPFELDPPDTLGDLDGLEPPGREEPDGDLLDPPVTVPPVPPTDPADPVDPVDPPDDPIEPEPPVEVVPVAEPPVEVIAAVLPVAPPAPGPVVEVEGEEAVFEIPDAPVPLAFAPPAVSDYVPTIVIEDSPVPLAAPIAGEVAGFITTGLILASLIAAVVGNSIRKMRTEEMAEE